MPSISQARLPLYRQLQEQLGREIATGRLRGRLPPEVELAQQLGVAVGTLRKALASLEQDGVLERRQGSGTYVRSAPSGSVYHFLRLERAESPLAGLPSAEILDITPAQDPACAQRLTLPAATPLWRIRRLRSLDATVVAAEEIWLAQARAPDLAQQTLHDSLYWFYQHTLQLRIAHVEDHIDVGAMPDWGPPCGPCGRVVRIAHDDNHCPAETSTTWFDPQQARYVARWQG